MKHSYLLGAAAAALLLVNANAAFAQASNAAPAATDTVATNNTAPLIPGGAAGAPASQSPVAAFWASLTGDAQQGETKTAQTASTDANRTNTH